MRAKRLHNSGRDLLGKVIHKAPDSGQRPTAGRWAAIATHLLLIKLCEAMKGLCHALEQTAKINMARWRVNDKQKTSFA
ncbi:MAG: hypothetical protein OEM31_09065 [Gammaproteobacteria bacterium]|nr:hypothetical protein [Gammaproteobacteria bacterium]